jgi:cyclic pyranopterin monophosphate synthase
VTDRLTHEDAHGKARMVDVSGKEPTARSARAVGAIRMRPETLAAIRDNVLKKGDALGVARIAGIMGAKRTADLIPLCHPIGLDDVQVTLTPDDTLPGIRVEASAATVGRTGVEMEALTAATVALLAVYDMAKGLDREMEIGHIALVEKTGGRSGTWKTSWKKG